MYERGTQHILMDPTQERNAELESSLRATQSVYASNSVEGSSAIGALGSQLASLSHEAALRQQEIGHLRQALQESQMATHRLEDLLVRSRAQVKMLKCEITTHRQLSPDSVEGDGDRSAQGTAQDDWLRNSSAES